MSPACATGAPIGEEAPKGYVAVRTGRASDLPMVIADWIKPLSSCPAWTHIERNFYHAATHCLIMSILDSPRTRTLVAYDTTSGSDDQNAAYIVYDRDQRVLFWQYTKPHYRQRFGLGRMLLGAAFGPSDRPVTAAVATPMLDYLKRVLPITVDTYALVKATR